MHILGRLLKYMFKYYKIQLAVVIVCIMLNSVAAISSSIFLQRIIADVIEPAVGGLGWDGVKNSLYKIIAVMAGVYAVGLICSFVYTRLMAVVTQGFLYHLRRDMFERMQSLPIKYFDTHTHGDIMSCYTNDVDAIRQLISQSLPQAFAAAVAMIVLLVTMLSFSIWLTIVVMLGVLVMLLITKKIGGNSAKFFIRQQRSVGKTEGFVEEMMNGQKVIKVFCHEEQSKADFDAINDNLFKDSESANRFGNILMPILGNIGYVLYVIVAIVGGLLVLYNVPNLSLTGLAAAGIGMDIIISFLNMSRQFCFNISQVSSQINAVVMATAGAGRIFALLDEKEEVDDGYVTLVNAKEDEDGNLVESEERTGIWAWKHPHKAEGTITYERLSGDIELNEVDFGYVENKIVLHDVTIHAHPGQKVAFVGATGAGKTTITNLINRFYDIADGKIRYDGININKIKKGDLRRSLGIVLQDTNLFTGTIMENIRYGRLDATDEECIAAAKLANAHDFITRLPGGYSTMLTGDGANLSQGQKQLLSIARAAVADAPVMILDEATSSIDTRTEALVQQGMDALMDGRTVFVIAHRLSTVQNSNVIIVLDHGRIIEKGSHDELIKQKGQYYQLYTGAFELE
ncbi:MAG: ABC transporter ATP-binding protein/permease [Clostridia bacterium]|nr:ABC transporter ATP-binding protein/permease [Clostridia bacterium]MDE7329059.1 ABC transporter ATP-binding protein/permease [Clostridia bacterium]